MPDELLGEAVNEIVAQFGAVSFRKDAVEGQWQHEDIVYRDALACVIVDVADTAANRKWMKGYKSRWKGRLKQLEIWMVSYPIEIE